MNPLANNWEPVSASVFDPNFFFMNRRALECIHQTEGWEIGSGSSVEIVDKGMARTLNSPPPHSSTYAFTFEQQGVMAGLGLQGTRIMRVRG